MNNFLQTIKLGQVSFINCLPLNFPLAQQHNPSLHIYNSYPADINSRLYKGTLHIAPISLAEYLAHQNHYQLIENLSISSFGQTASVVLFSNEVLDDLSGKTVLVPYTSATSINMLKMILKHQNIQPKAFITHFYEEPLETQLFKHSAILYIGDPALQENHNHHLNCYKYDLGELWFRLTGLPAVYGVWAASKKWYHENTSDYHYITDLLHNALQAGMGELFDDIVQEACHITQLNNNIIRHYFQNNINYTLQEDHRQSIKLFQQEFTKLPSRFATAIK